VSTDNTFILSLLTVTVALSLGRPHSSCMDARPEAHAGTKGLTSNTQAPALTTGYSNKEIKKKMKYKKTEKKKEMGRKKSKSARPPGDIILRHNM
jgi:hypothetical protein